MLNKFRNAVIATGAAVALLCIGLDSIKVETPTSVILFKILFISFVGLIAWNSIAICENAIKEVEKNDRIKN